MRTYETLLNNDFIRKLDDGKELILEKENFHVYRIPYNNELYSLMGFRTSNPCYAIYDSNLLWDDKSAWRYFGDKAKITGALKKLIGVNKKGYMKWKSQSQWNAEKELTSK
jgi:hypothetical protein